ncbi:hypothetical protein SLA2020_122690 [Shorea laevis]
MTTLSFIVGVIGNVISVLLFLSPLGTFRRIVKNRSTEEFESLPYICTFLNSALWTYYGIIKSGSYLVATVNGFGAVVEIVFLTLFLIFAPPRTRAKTAILVGLLDVGFLAAAVLIAQLILNGDLRIDVIGFLGAGLNIIMYGSPLAAMKTVVTTKSVEYMPFLLSLFVCLNGGIWTFYAVLVADYFLGVPNGIGFLLGAAQLLLYAIYRKPRSPKRSPDDLEDGWQHEHLISSSPSVNENNEDCCIARTSPVSFFSNDRSIHLFPELYPSKTIKSPPTPPPGKSSLDTTAPLFSPPLPIFSISKQKVEASPLARAEEDSPFFAKLLHCVDLSKLKDQA